MTVNELIDVLKGSGDDGFRDMAKVRLVDRNGNCIDDNLNPFDVKAGMFNVDIPVDVGITVQDGSKFDDDESDLDDEDGLDDWDEDEDEDDDDEGLDDWDDDDYDEA